MKRTMLLFAGLLVVARPGQGERIQVVTTTSDLASIVKEIGQEKVEVTSLLTGQQDPHFVEPRPSMVVKVKKADLVVAIGLDLDLWVYSVIDAARNPKVNPGKVGFLDVSGPITKLEVLPPGSKVDGSMGDVHPLGNPHYWLDPENGRLIARQVAERLGELSPGEKDFFLSNLKMFEARIEQLVVWARKTLEKSGEIKAVSYHRSLSYFCRRFPALNIVAELEPKPGIPPGPAHLAKVGDLMKRERVSMVLIEPFYDRKAADFVARQTGARVVIFPQSVGATAAAKDYFSLFETIISLLCRTNQTWDRLSLSGR